MGLWLSRFRTRDSLSSAARSYLYLFGLRELISMLFEATDESASDLIAILEAEKPCKKTFMSQYFFLFGR